MNADLSASRRVARTAWTNAGASAGERAIAEEMAIAVVYDGGTEAVMMATPADLEDFAIGFSITEGIVQSAQEIESFECLELDLGIELRMRLNAPVASALAKRRRMRAGPVGCGLCGVQSLEAALALTPRIASDVVIAPSELVGAMSEMSAEQSLNQTTHSAHAAAFYHSQDGLVALREDVGRHNALDKLAGALARLGRDAGGGAILLSSRLSVDLVQKAARLNAPVIAAVSAPTALALQTARDAGIAVAAIVRADGLEAFTHAERFGLSVLEA